MNIDSVRLDALIEDAHRALDRALADADQPVKGIVGLFSGGNDSTTVAHLFRDRVTHYAHANTLIGIEETRQYVRDVCASWGVPLLERYPEPGGTYEDIVLGRCKPKTARAKHPVVWPGGFPGPAAHAMIYQRIKERALSQVRAEIVKNSRRERVVFLAGRRAEESSRRKSRVLAGTMSQIERRGSIIWVSPVINWTKLDLNSYRSRFPDVPRNEVSDTLHMSGECLCGCFTHEGELAEIEFWFPEVAAYLRGLEQRVQAEQVAGRLPGVKPEHCRWGWNSRGKCASGLCNN